MGMEIPRSSEMSSSLCLWLVLNQPVRVEKSEKGMVVPSGSRFLTCLISCL